MARVLVTGATGFIGRHLIRRLVEQGDQVRCLVRNLGQPPPLPAAVECVLGDVTAPDSLDGALTGIETVYHLAGATLALRETTFHQVNCEGTRHLAEACVRQSVPPTLVYVSSLAAAGPASDSPLTEEAPPRPMSHYGRSKLGGEQHLRALADRLPCTVLRPPCVFGPGEPYMLKILWQARLGIMLRPGRCDFRLSWVYVEDLVEAMVLATERGRRLAADTGASWDETGVYFVALEERPTVRELADLIAEAVGTRIRWNFAIPAPLCRLGAHVNEWRAWLTGRPYWINTDKIREALAGSWTCDAGKAKRELGFTCRTDLRTGLRTTIQWYCEQGLV
jgi:nucleoside-diphosphate-sugar epimerase